MGLLWDLIQKHIDTSPYRPSERRVAEKLGVSPNALRYWRNPKSLPTRENLQAIADLVGVRYSVVLDAALHDTGYHESGVVSLPDRREPDPGSPDREEWLALQALRDAEDAIRGGRLRESPELLARLRRELEVAQSATEAHPNELP